VWKVSDVVWKVSRLIWKVSLLKWKWYIHDCGNEYLPPKTEKRLIFTSSPSRVFRMQKSQLKGGGQLNQGQEQFLLARKSRSIKRFISSIIPPQVQNFLRHVTSIKTKEQLHISPLHHITHHTP
jgi:hypothetical protein